MESQYGNQMKKGHNNHNGHSWCKGKKKE